MKEEKEPEVNTRYEDWTNDRYGKSSQVKTNKKGLKKKKTDPTYTGGWAMADKTKQNNTKQAGIAALQRAGAKINTNTRGGCKTAQVLRLTTDRCVHRG